MEPTKARQLLKEVKKYELQFCSICSSPSAGTFTTLQKTITYNPCLAKSSVFSFFDASEKTLTKSTSGAIGTAVSHLKAVTVLNDNDLLSSLVESIQISENEKEQFAYISFILLHHLAGMFSLNSKKYSTYFPNLIKVQPLTWEPMGMGETTTWCLIQFGVWKLKFYCIWLLIIIYYWLTMLLTKLYNYMESRA